MVERDVLGGAAVDAAGLQVDRGKVEIQGQANWNCDLFRSGKDLQA